MVFPGGFLEGSQSRVECQERMGEGELASAVGVLTLPDDAVQVHRLLNNFIDDLGRFPPDSGRHRLLCRGSTAFADPERRGLDGVGDLERFDPLGQFGNRGRRISAWLGSYAGKASLELVA